MAVAINTSNTISECYKCNAGKISEMGRNSDCVLPFLPSPNMNKTNVCAGSEGDVSPVGLRARATSNSHPQLWTQRLTSEKCRILKANHMHPCLYVRCTSIKMIPNWKAQEAWPVSVLSWPHSLGRASGLQEHHLLLLSRMMLLYAATDWHTSSHQKKQPIWLVTEIASKLPGCLFPITQVALYKDPRARLWDKLGVFHLVTMLHWLVPLCPQSPWQVTQRRYRGNLSLPVWLPALSLFQIPA